MNKDLLLAELEKTTNTGCWSYEIASSQLFWSDETFRIHGLNNKQVPNVEDAINYYHKEDRPLVKESFENCIASGTEFKLKLRILNLKGETVFVESYGKPLLENNKITTIFGYLKNISKEVFLVDQKSKNADKFKSLMNTVKDFFIVAETDEKGIITFVNNKFCELSEYTEGELIGENHNIINSAHHDAEFFSNLWATIKSGKSWEGIICNRKKTGDLYWVQSFIFPKLVRNKIIGYTALRYDVTESYLLSEELDSEREHAELAAQLAAVGEISAGIAHEINNPLTIILAKNKIIQKKVEDHERVEKMSLSIEKSANRIVKIVKGLHHLAQKSRGGEHETRDLMSILNYTFDFCEEALKSHYIELNLECTDDNIHISCDEIKISQILLNLINNARDSIVESKAKDKWILIRITKLESTVEVCIYDSGPGVAEEDREKVLKAFYTTKQVGKGTGLGLSLVTRFLKEHDGTLEIISDELGKGFMFTLPLVK